MGITFSKLYKKFFKGKDMRILMVGLDAAGKTTVLYRLKLGEMINTIPTLGFNVETVEYEDLEFTIWDVGGQDRIRPLWRYYFDNTDAIIYVVDSNDKKRINEAHDELQKLLGEEQLENSVLLVLSNKQDLPDSMDSNKMAEELGLTSLRNRRWFVQPTVATTGDGLIEGFEWLSTALKKRN